MKKEFKNTIFDTVSTLRKLFTKLTVINESNARKMTELEKQVGITKDARVERTGITNNYIGELSSGTERTIQANQSVRYSGILKGKTTQKVFN